MNGIEKRLCLRDIASQLKALRKKTDNGRIFGTEIVRSAKMSPCPRDIAHSQISQRRIGQQKHALWIELDGLRVERATLFPLSLSTSSTAEKFHGYRIVRILPVNRFELDLSACKITFDKIFVEAFRKLCLHQIRSEFHRHVEGLARRFRAPFRLIDIINECQPLLTAQVRPSDREFGVKPRCVLKCLDRF